MHGIQISLINFICYELRFLRDIYHDLGSNISSMLKMLKLFYV